MASIADAKEDAIIFSTLTLLQLLKDSQQQHGLRHGDYQRYRAYCTRRISRIRKSIHFKHQHPRRGGNFKPKKVTFEDVKDSRYLLAVLFEAERCWAYAMQLKQEENRPRNKFHALNRLKKGVQHSQLLEELCRKLGEMVDARTKLEAQAYNAWLKGCLFFEEQQWQQALEQFAAAKTIYENLAKAVSPAEAGAYQQRCQEMIPQLRYCQYNIGDDTAISELMQMRLKMDEGDSASRGGLLGAELDALIAEEQTRQARGTGKIQWCGHQFPLPEKPAKARSFCTALPSYEKQLAEIQDYEAKVNFYEKILIDCRDAIQAVRDEYKAEFLPSGETGDQQKSKSLSAPHLLHSYLVYVRLSKTIERYLIMIERQREKKASKPQDLVRLYDTVLQNFEEILALPGAENSTFQKELHVKENYHRAIRCEYLADAASYMKKWPEASALADRAIQYAEAAINDMKVVKIPDLSANVLEDLRKKMTVAKYTTLANHIIDSQAGGETSDEAAAAVGNDIPIDEDLKTFRWIEPAQLAAGKGPPLTRLPPDFKPIPCRPVFFDLAENYVEFPSLEDRLEPEKAQQAGASGLTGMVKGWIWGGGSKK